MTEAGLRDRSDRLPGSTRHGRRRFALVALAASIAAAVGIGHALAPDTALRVPDAPTTSTAPGAGPGFVPSEGWETFSTGLTRSNQAPTAIASSVPLEPDDLAHGAGNFPRATIDALPTDGLLICAVFYPRGEIAVVDATFPEGPLSASLSGASEGSIEGDPRPEHASFRLLSGFNGWNTDLIVFTGSDETTDALEEAAVAQLRRLVIPQRLAR